MDPATKTLFAAMLAILNIWAPKGIDEEREAEVKRLATLFVEVGQEGRIISKEADPFIIAAVSYYESHWKEHVLGDCVTRGNRKVCSSFGPMQVSNGAPTWLFRADPIWKGVTVAELKKPAKNVKAGYHELAYVYKACKKTVAHGMMAYRYGRCVKKKNVSRCFLAKELARLQGVTDWKCGHEGIPAGKLSKQIKKALAGVPANNEG